MTLPEPTDETMDRARTEQQAADEARTTRARENWRDQADGIERGMADAVERATAMGDRVEPSTLPPDRRPDDADPAATLDLDGPRRVDPDGERRATPRDDA